ncbi:hypothetical protein KY385_04740 [Candidatus Parcubacteria bacterium]|nr:hypothetical protein [Candidatus Parcubacteria bacterium]
MSETFDAAKLRRVAQGNEAFVELLPEGVLELFQIVRFSTEQGVECGNGLKTLGKVATNFLHSGPKVLEDTIAFDWSSTHGLFVPLQAGEFNLRGQNERPKKITEYTTQESEEWARFFAGLDPSDSSITRDTAIAGLAALKIDMGSKIGSVSKYALDPGENTLVFDRARDILTGTPFVIATSVLPDMTAVEASRIFSIRQDQHPELVNEFVERAQGPIFEAP